MSTDPAVNHQLAFRRANTILRNKNIDIGKRSAAGCGQTERQIGRTFEQHDRNACISERHTNALDFAQHRNILLSDRFGCGNQVQTRRNGDSGQASQRHQIRCQARKQIRSPPLAYQQIPLCQRKIERGGRIEKRQGDQ